MGKTKIFLLTAAIFFLFCASSLYAKSMDVFVSIPPQKWLTDHIGGDRVTTHILINKGQDPHTFEPSPVQIAKLANASLYFMTDMPFEKIIVRILQQNGTTLHIVNAAENISKIPIQMHHDTHSHHDHGTKQQQNLDPHIWLSPINLKIMAQNITVALANEDPTNRKLYEDNFAQVEEILNELHKRLLLLLAPYQGETILVFHPSFGYFTHTYNLHQEAVEVAGKAPTPKQLVTIIQKAKEENIRVIFVQPQFDTKSGAAVAAAISGRVVPLDPLAEDIIGNLLLMGDSIAEALDKK